MDPSVLRNHPFFWEAPAPKVQGLGADSNSDQIGLAPAPTKFDRLRLQAKKGGSKRLWLHTLKFVILCEL